MSRSEMRVLRYLPTNLSTPDIARELSVSVTTVRTLIHHLFVTLDVHPYDRGHLSVVVPGKISVHNGVLPGR